MARPTDLTTCSYRKIVDQPFVVDTPEEAAIAQPGDYVVTDATGQPWVFTRSQLEAVRSARAARPPRHQA